MPEPRPAGGKADAAEDVERHPAGRDPLSARVQGSHTEGQMVEQQGALHRPGERTVGLEDDRREDLDPIGEQLTVIGLAQLARLSVDAEAPGSIAGHARGAHVAGAAAHRLQRLGDPPRYELVVTRRLGAVAPLEGSLAVLAGAVPRLLPRQEFGEHVRLSARARRALVALPPVARRSIGAVELDP